MMKKEKRLESESLILRLECASLEAERSGVGSWRLESLSGELYPHLVSEQHILACNSRSLRVPAPVGSTRSCCPLLVSYYKSIRTSQRAKSTQAHTSKPPQSARGINIKHYGSRW